MANSRSLKAGDAFIRFSLNDSQVRKQLKRLQKRFTAIGASLQKLSRIGLKAGAGVAAGMVLPSKAASDLQETMGKFNTVFGDNSKSVKQWSDNFAGAVGRSKGEVAGFLASMQDLFVPLGFASDEATGLSKSVTALAVDLASFNNKSDAEALRDLQAALTGSGETMKKYGVIVNEAAVKQQLLSQGLDPSAASEMEKVQARLAIITAGTTAAQGDAIRTSGSFANQMKRLKGSAIDFAAAIGQPLLGPLSSAAGWFADLAQRGAAGAAGFFDAVREYLTKAADVASVRLAAMWEVMKTVWGSISSVVSTVWQSISGIVFQGIKYIDKVIVTGLKTISFAFKNWRLLLDGAVTSAMLSVVRFSNQVVHTFGTVIPTWLVWFADNWRDVFTDVWTMTKTVGSNILVNLSNLWDAIASIFRGEGFTFEWTGLTDGFKSAIKELPQIAAREMGPLETSLQNRMDEIGQELVDAWDDNTNKIEANAKQFSEFAAKSFAADEPVKQAQRAIAAGAKAAANVTRASARGLFNISAVQSLQGGGADEVTELRKQTGHLDQIRKKIDRNKLVVTA